MKTLLEKFAELFQSNLPVITEGSTLHEIAHYHPHLPEFIERKYGIKLDSADKSLSLSEFSEKFGLPPAQIIFMEVQLNERLKKVSEIPAREAKTRIEIESNLIVLDAREEWELKMGSLPKSRPLSPQILDEILAGSDYERPLLVYCHFGVRSTDAAMFFADRGFKKVFILKGGIDSWSQEVDPTIARYQGSYC